MRGPPCAAPPADADPVDVISEHRLRHLDLLPAALADLPEGERAHRLHAAFLDRIPYENLSNNLAVAEARDRPEAWMRATDRLLRENAAQGLGGTSFSLAYALTDLMRGAGLQAHTTLGHNLVTERAHAAVVVYVEGAPLLFDPALLLCGPLPVRPGGILEDPLGRLELQPRCGATLTLTLRVCDALRDARRAAARRDEGGAWSLVARRSDVRPVYSILPVPAPPPSFRQAWLASFCKGRALPLRLARRRGNVIYRYGERPHTLEILTPTGCTEERLPPSPVARLVEVFGLDGECLGAWFRSRRRA